MSTLQPTLDQYKSYLQDLGNIGSRYTTANTFYFSIISALMGSITLFKSPVTSQSQLFLQVAISSFAILLCYVWKKTIEFYRELFRAKFTVLKEMEEDGGFFPMYKKEYEVFVADGKPWLLANEKYIPVILSMPFFVIVMVTVLKLCGYADHLIKAI
jgi:hypothetical protein